MNVAFLTNIISPYRRGVFERLAHTPGWNLRIFINAASEFDRAWSVDTSSLPVTTTRTRSLARTLVTHQPVRFEQRIELHLPTGLWSDLSKFKPDVIISHEMGPRSIIAAAFARRHDIPLVIWAYQSRISITQGGRFKRLLRSRLLRHAHTIVGMGTQAREALRSLNVPDHRIIDAPNAADHPAIESQLHSHSFASDVATLRSQANGRSIALVVGRLIPLKGITELLRAWTRLPQRLRDRWVLTFAGDGPMRPIIEAHKAPDIRCVGHVKTSQIACWYRAADLHIFPTLGDVWGLVVNEASHCATPTLCSRHAGCADDLIQHHVNGLLFDAADPTDYDRQLQHALTLSAHERTAMGHLAQTTASTFTLDQLANAFRTAVARSPSKNPTSRATDSPPEESVSPLWPATKSTGVQECSGAVRVNPSAYHRFQLEEPVSEFDTNPR